MHSTLTMLVVTCRKLSGVLHELSGFTHDYPVSLDVTSCYVTCGLVMLRLLTCAWLLHQASPQQDYGVAHRFLYLVCLAALLSLQVHPAHCNSFDLNNFHGPSASPTAGCCSCGTALQHCRCTSCICGAKVCHMTLGSRCMRSLFRVLTSL